MFVCLLVCLSVCLDRIYCTLFFTWRGIPSSGHLICTYYWHRRLSPRSSFLFIHGFTILRLCISFDVRTYHIKSHGFGFAFDDSPHSPHSPHLTNHPTRPKQAKVKSKSKSKSKSRAKSACLLCDTTPQVSGWLTDWPIFLFACPHQISRNLCLQQSRLISSHSNPNPSPFSPRLTISSFCYTASIIST